LTGPPGGEIILMIAVAVIAVAVLTQYLSTIYGLTDRRPVTAVLTVQYS